MADTETTPTTEMVPSPAQPGNAALTRTVERFTMVVPGDWTVLPLDPKTRDRRIAGIVERRMPRGDRYAYMRHQAMMQLRRASADAASKGAFFAAIHNSSAKGMPLCASAMAAMVPPAKDADGNVLLDAEATAAALMKGDDKGQVLETSVVDLNVGPAARVRRRGGTGLRVQDGREVLAENVQYYVCLPEAPGTLALIYSTPILSLADVYTKLFDVMANTARWVAAPPDQREAEPEAEEVVS